MAENGVNIYPKFGETRCRESVHWDQCVTMRLVSDQRNKPVPYNIQSRQYSLVVNIEYLCRHGTDLLADSQAVQIGNGTGGSHITGPK